MKKIIFLTSMVLSLAACGDNRFSTDEDRQNSAQENMNKSILVCRDNVEYISFTNAYGRTYTAHLQVDGKPYTC